MTIFNESTSPFPKLSRESEEKILLASDECHWCGPEGPIINLEMLFRILMAGPPAWSSTILDPDSNYLIPMLPAVDGETMPVNAVAFDKLPSASHPEETVIDFYVDDRKLLSLLRNPQRFAERFERFWGIISPDYSVWLGQGVQFGALATWCNRAVGLVFAQRGIRVIPQIRWTQKADFEHCFDGVTRGSTVAISNKGLWNDRMLRGEFLAGLPVLMERLQPTAIVLQGHDSEEIRKLIGPGATVHVFPTRQQSLRQAS